ncbi:hypothetical protein HYU08_02120 [Candidatus Woesearchaeota archaeon]|nr:hypothetical protein [Candidatus Woesearchaeota archaeon]
MGKYYVSLYFDKKEDYTAASGDELLDLAFQHRCNGHGDPRMNNAIPQSPDPDDIAFLFGDAQRASDFAREALGLENIVGVRIGLVDQKK